MKCGLCEGPARRITVEGVELVKCDKCDHRRCGKKSFGAGGTCDELIMDVTARKCPRGHLL